MTQGERVQVIRKSAKVNLTLEKFGEKIGIKKSAVSKIEKGENALTEQNIKAICREFGVDYIWLTTGEGEMFSETDDDFQEKIDQIMIGESTSRKNLIKSLLYASDEDIDALERIIDYYISLSEKKD